MDDADIRNINATIRTPYSMNTSKVWCFLKGKIKQQPLFISTQ